MNAQQLHRLGLPAASAKAPQGARGVHALALEPVGPIPACVVRGEEAQRFAADRQLRAFQPAPQALAAAAVQWAQQVGRSMTDETRPAPLGD